MEAIFSARIDSKQRIVRAYIVLGHLWPLFLLALGDSLHTAVCGGCVIMWPHSSAISIN